VLFGFFFSGSKNSGAARNKTSNGAGDESNIGDFGEPVDFKADDFVSAMDKLLQGMNSERRVVENFSM